MRWLRKEKNVEKPPLRNYDKLSVLFQRAADDHRHHSGFYFRIASSTFRHFERMPQYQNLHLRFEWTTSLTHGMIYAEKELVTVVLNPDLGDSIVELVTPLGSYTVELQDEPPYPSATQTVTW